MTRQQVLTSLWLLVATALTMSGVMSASVDSNRHVDKHDHRRSSLLRGVRGEKNNASGRGERALKNKKSAGAGLDMQDFVSTLAIYQMDTSFPTSESEMSSMSSIQPFYKVKQDGASGRMVYRPIGWELMYGFAARNLPPNTAYELVIQYPNTSAEDVPGMLCLGSGSTGEHGALFIANSVPVEASMSGAKVWLAMASDVDCSLEKAQMVPNSVPDYAKYMFAPAGGSVEFEYLGE